MLKFMKNISIPPCICRGVGPTEFLRRFYGDDALADCPRSLEICRNRSTKYSPKPLPSVLLPGISTDTVAANGAVTFWPRRFTRSRARRARREEI